MTIRITLHKEVGLPAGEYLVKSRDIFNTSVDWSQLEMEGIATIRPATREEEEYFLLMKEGGRDRIVPLKNKS